MNRRLLWQRNLQISPCYWTMSIFWKRFLLIWQRLSKGSRSEESMHELYAWVLSTWPGMQRCSVYFAVEARFLILHCFSPKILCDSDEKFYKEINPNAVVIKCHKCQVLGHKSTQCTLNFHGLIDVPTCTKVIESFCCDC